PYCRDDSPERRRSTSLVPSLRLLAVCSGLSCRFSGTVASTMPAPAIEFRDVTFRRTGRSPVLDHFNLAVEPGDVLALVGRSGAGKTTLLKLVNRLHQQDDGVVLVEGRDTAQWEPIRLRRHIGYV